ncbi:MAG: M24 family metallopeptidase [Anaerolineae bacterium]
MLYFFGGLWQNGNCLPTAVTYPKGFLMIGDLDQLMDARQLDAILVQGKVSGNPPLIYMLGGVHLTHAIVIKQRGETPTLIVGPMDREAAATVGFNTVLNTRYRYSELLRRHDGDSLAAGVAYYDAIFEDLGVSGRVGCYGYLDQGYAYTLLSALNASLVDVELMGEFKGDLFHTARATKDAAEVARIREVGRRTAAIVRDTVAFLQSREVDDGRALRKPDGSVLKVGDMHGEITHLIAEYGLEDPEGFIFATGRSAGIPHSRGDLEAPMRLGEPIVFDIFPREIGGGYFFDLTRTFCLGYAPSAMLELYKDVLDCLSTLKSAIEVGEETRSYQQMACSFFAARGHPTVADDPSVQEGYVHGVAHGVGLDIHELPGFQDDPSNTMTLTPGHLFAIEPGLYYPDQGLGCRVEDVLWIDADGNTHNLTDFPYDLVVPMKKRTV